MSANSDQSKSQRRGLPQRDRTEPCDEASQEEIDNLLRAVAALGPRDRIIVLRLIGRVATIARERGAQAACQALDRITITLPQELT